MLKEKKGKRQPEAKPNKAEALAAAKAFLKENLAVEPACELVMLGEYVFLKPEIKLPQYGVFAAGVCVGELQKGRIVPHHQLFSAYGKDFKLKLELTGDQIEAEKYLKGEEISCEGYLVSNGNKTGYAAVLIDGCPVGGGKVSGSVCKNHYPKGLRNTI